VRGAPVAVGGRLATASAAAACSITPGDTPTRSQAGRRSRHGGFDASPSNAARATLLRAVCWQGGVTTRRSETTASDRRFVVPSARAPLRLHTASPSRGSEGLWRSPIGRPHPSRQSGHQEASEALYASRRPRPSKPRSNRTNPCGRPTWRQWRRPSRQPLPRASRGTRRSSLIAHQSSIRASRASIIPGPAECSRALRFGATYWANSENMRARISSGAFFLAAFDFRSNTPNDPVLAAVVAPSYPMSPGSPIITRPDVVPRGSGAAAGPVSPAWYRPLRPADEVRPLSRRIAPEGRPSVRLHRRP
jgi:hypothetical protein